MIALLAAALAALPALDVSLALSLRGERVGAVRVRWDGSRYRYESLTVVRRGSELSTQRFEATTDANGKGRTSDGRALEGPLPSTLALWMFRDGDANRCIPVEDERDGHPGQVCATRQGRTLSGTLLGEPFTALLDGDNGPTALDLPGQKAHFVRADGELPLPAPRDLFGGSKLVQALKNLEGTDRARVRGSSSTCSVDAVLERASPGADEPLAPVVAGRWTRIAGDLRLGTRTRWSTAVALAKFVDQAIASVPASPADERADEVWSARKGSCVGQARLFASLAQALGLPTRVVYGALVEDAKVAPHAWDEVQLGAHWYGVDPSRGAAPLGPEHIPLAREGDPDPLRAGRCLLALPAMKWDVEAR